MLRLRLLLLLLLPGVGACTTQYVYSTDPVDYRGYPLPLDRATGLVFEDGRRLRLNPGEKLELVDGRFTCVYGNWNVSQVDALLWTDYLGRPEKSDVLTPDDLVGNDDVPRITRVRLAGGEEIDVAATGGQARFSDNGLALEIFGPGLNRTVPLEEVHTVELHRANLAESTVKSWRFWAVGGAAVVVAVIITRQTDPDTIAVR